MAAGIGDAGVVAVDKSMSESLGPKWHQRDRKRGVIPEGLRNVDPESGWGYSAYRGWVQGYAWHLVCSAAAGHPAIPLLSEVEPNNVQENKVLAPMIAQLPPETRRVIADEGYDDNELILMVERKARRGFRRRMLVPMAAHKHTPEWRLDYVSWYQSETGQALFRRRKITIEPLFEILKNLFDHRRNWMKGLKNNRAIMLLIVLCYQLLIYYNWKRGSRLSGVKEILDGI